MSGFSTVAARFKSAGLPGVLFAARRRLAKVIAPTSAPPSKPKPKPAAPAVATPPAAAPITSGSGLLSAVEATHEEALGFFVPRRQNYVDLAEALRQYLPTDGVMFDVGANIGYFTKVVGEELAFQGQVHLFEPVPHLSSLCQQTLATVPFATALHRYGLSDADDTVDIYLAGDGNLGWNTMVAGKKASTMSTLSIDVRRFDDAGIKVTPDVVKIDVEGAEHRVLAGMMGSLESWSPKPTLLCEIGWGSGHPDWDAELEIFASLERLGYRTTELDGTEVDLSALTKTTDVLFVHADNERA